MAIDLKSGVALTSPTDNSVLIGANAANSVAPGLWKFSDILSYLRSKISASYLDFSEISSPANPATDAIRLFAKDVAGVTKLFTRDSAGTEVQVGAGAGSAGREVLTGNRTYFIRSDGDDANTGLVNSAGGAFKTTQKAMDTIAALDISIYNATIQCGNTGPFTGCLLKAPVGAGTVIINGDTANPSNYTFTKNGSSSYIFDGQSAVGKFQISGVHPHDSTAAYHIISGVAGNIIVANNNDYGDCTLYPLAAKYGGNLQPTGANNKLSCSGTITALFLCDTNSNLTAPSATTFTWLRNIAFGQFVLARWGGILNLANLTCALAGFTATGARYNADSNAVIIVGGGGASFFPGSTSGSTSNGGLYS